MSSYLYLGKYTGTGIQGVIAEGGSSRETATRAAFESVGGHVLSYGFLQGEYDFYVLAEVPDDRMALVPPMLAGGSGTVSVTTARVYSPAELDVVTAKAREISFSAAGH